MDNKMNDILKNFASASGEKNSPMLTDSETGGPKQNKALIEKNAMKKLLEGLDAGQKKAKQMPATHVMPKEKKGAKHPVGDYLVGGEFDDDGQELQDEPEVASIAPEDVIAVWQKVFPNSAALAGKGFGGGHFFKFKLAKDKSEVSNGIWENDPLNYSAFLNEDGSWEETATSMAIAPPEDSHLAYESAKFRKKKAKNVTLAMLEKRFNTVKEFVVANADKLKSPDFDIKSKLGEGLVDEEKLGKKRSLFDILQTMESEDEEDEKETRDFHKKEKKSAQNYKRGANGKPNLAENADNAMYDLRAHIQNLAYFSTSIDMIGEEFDTNNGDTFVVLAKKIVKAVKEIRAENSPVKFKEDGPVGTKSQDIHTRDPRASQIIKKARNEYSIAADDDLGAIVNMMHDTDVDHDAGIDDNSDVNDDQESDISAILKRLADLERGKL